MKAQRRHDLQQNDLSKVITKAPTFWQQSGGKFLAVLVAVLVIVILIRYRISTNRQGQVQARDSLAQARTAINELQGTVQASFSPGAANEAAVQRRSAFNEGNAALSQAMTLSDDRKLQAEALIARGDLNWTAATLPELPGAATQPSLQLRDPRSCSTRRRSRTRRC